MNSGLDDRPQKGRRRQQDAARSEQPMDPFLLSPFLVAGQECDQNAGDDASSVRPVVDPGQEETEKDESHDPSHGLPVNRFAVESPPALAVV